MYNYVWKVPLHRGFESCFFDPFQSTRIALKKASVFFTQQEHFTRWNTKENASKHPKGHVENQELESPWDLCLSAGVLQAAAATPQRGPQGLRLGRAGGRQGVGTLRADEGRSHDESGTLWFLGERVGSCFFWNVFFFPPYIGDFKSAALKDPGRF